MKEFDNVVTLEDKRIPIQARRSIGPFKSQKILKAGSKGVIVDVLERGFYVEFGDALMSNGLIMFFEGSSLAPAKTDNNEKTAGSESRAYRIEDLPYNIAQAILDTKVDERLGD